MTFLVGCIFLIIGFLFLLKNTWVNSIFAIITLGNGANLIIFSIGKVVSHGYPFAKVGAKFESSIADPLTQALILTAIVISFATLCFVISVIKKINDSREKGKA
ncbi:NADH-quinone oxidoreductase subunit K [Oceanospirillum sp. RT-1-3]|uniref:NADH-quinone oxidoreductase subunit K n=1 Tax=unclassified Halobacteriovorax TaxID=2639665 RepID=UPI00399AB767